MLVTVGRLVVWRWRLRSTFPIELTGARCLKKDSQPLDLESERERLLGLSAEELQKISSSYKIGEINFLRDQKPVSIRFPSLYSLDKVKSYSLDKVELVQDTLLGIKGQYLVINKVL